jgi:two-component system, NtrC family, sensor histidine kinase AtoS
MRFQAQLTVLFLAMLFIPIFGMGVLALDYSADAMVSDLERSAHMLADQILAQMKVSVSSGTEAPLAQLRASAALRKLLDSSQAFGLSVVSASLIAPDGTVVIASRGDTGGKAAEPFKAISTLSNLTSQWIPFAIIGELWNARVYELRSPVFADGRPLATISVVVTTAMMADRVRRLTFIVLSTAAAGIILACILLFLFTNRMFRQLFQIARDFGKLADADCGVELVEVNGDEELAALAARFNELSRRVSAGQSQLVSGGDHLFDVVRSLQDAIILLEPSNSILFANQQARDRLTTGGDKMEGRSLKSILGDDHPLVRLVLSAIDAGVEAHDVTLELDQGNSLLVSLYRLGHGRTPAGLIAVIRDMNPVLELQTALDYSNRLARLGAHISGVAHQLRSPLQGMNLRLELLRGAGLESKERHIEKIRQEVERLDKAVEALLCFMRPERLKLTDFDLNQLAREVAAQTKGNHVRVEYRFAQGLPLVRADRSMIREALSNVITNAVQAMPASGVLTLSTRATGIVSELTITDTGAGIEKERLDHIFDLYYTTKPHGSGLGLALALRAIELNKGTIKIDSRVGAGTSCIISLPTGETLAAETALASNA